MWNMPHFRASVRILDGVIDRGALPGKQMKLVLAWCEIHRDELMQNWELARDQSL